MVVWGHPRERLCRPRSLKTECVSFKRVWRVCGANLIAPRTRPRGRSGPASPQTRVKLRSHPENSLSPRHPPYNISIGMIVIVTFAALIALLGLWAAINRRA